MNENVLITLRVDEVEELIDDLSFSAKKLNSMYKEGAGEFQEKLSIKLDNQLRNHFSKQMNQESNKSINTPKQWACKYDAFLLNEYEFTQEELDELQADRIRQSRRETS